MVIVYASNSGYTKEYAMLLRDKLDLCAYSVDDVPEAYKGGDAIFLGWLLAGKIVGYEKAKKLCNVKCVVGVGMTAESEEQTAYVSCKVDPPANVRLFYLQGGYDYNKLHGIYKLMMKVKSKEILARYDGMSDEAKKANATYRMVTEGYSVVSEERLAPVIDWANSVL